MVYIWHKCTFNFLVFALRPACVKRPYSELIKSTSYKNYQ